MVLKYQIGERAAVPKKAGGPTAASKERDELKDVLRALTPDQSLNLEVATTPDGKSNMRKLKRMVTTASNELKEEGVIKTGFLHQESEDRSILYVYLPDPNKPATSRGRPRRTPVEA
jgi:hypothetical protein